MRARDRDLLFGAGAEFGLAHDLVGIGGVLGTVPATLEEAIRAMAAEHGPKAARMLKRFAELPSGVFVWTESAGGYHLGQVAGRWRYDDTDGARTTGIHHVRPTAWLPRPVGDREVPEAVAVTFARGGRNLQRVRNEEAEREAGLLWDARDPR